MFIIVRAIPLKSGEGEREFLSSNKWDSTLENINSPPHFLLDIPKSPYGSTGYVLIYNRWFMIILI